MYIDAARRDAAERCREQRDTRVIFPGERFPTYARFPTTVNPYARLVALAGNPLPLCAPKFEKLYRVEMGG